MTWALAKVTKFFAICMSLRNSLKILKKVSTSHEEDLSDKQKKLLAEQCSGILMFWTIFGVFVVLEQYCEFLVRWFPMYYYAKTFFILFMAFPRLRFTDYVFYKVLVPSVEFIHDNVWTICAMPPGDILLLLVFKIIFVCFPMISHSDEPVKEKRKLLEVLDEALILDSDFEDGEIDLDESLNDDSKDESKLNDEIHLDKSFESPSKDSLSIVMDSPVEETSAAKDRREYVGEELRHNRHGDKDEGKSWELSFDDNDDINTDDGFTLSLPTLSGFDSDDDSKPSPSPKKKSDGVYESPSRVLRSFRKLLTGDSNTRLSETIFNLDLHSPPPNTQYRHRKSGAVAPSPSPTKKTRQSDGGYLASSSRSETSRSVFNLGRSASLQESRRRQPDPEDSYCYSPLHGAPKGSTSLFNKENISQAGDSLDDLLSDSKDMKSHITVRRRASKKPKDSQTPARDDAIKKTPVAELKSTGLRQALRSSSRTRNSIDCKTGNTDDDKVERNDSDDDGNPSLFKLRRSVRKTRSCAKEEK